MLRKIEKRKGGDGLKSPLLSSRASLQPLGKFLCPQCNHSQVISRLGITVLPPVSKSANYASSPGAQRSRNTSSPIFNSPLRPSSPDPCSSRKTSSSSDQRCSFHANSLESYCYSCNKQLCRDCVVENHMLHHIGKIGLNCLIVNVLSTLNLIF